MKNKFFAFILISAFLHGILADILKLSNERLIPNQLKRKHRFVFPIGRTNSVTFSRIFIYYNLIKKVDIMFLYTKPNANLYLMISKSGNEFSQYYNNLTQTEDGFMMDTPGLCGSDILREKTTSEKILYQTKITHTQLSRPFAQFKDSISGLPDGEVFAYLLYCGEGNSESFKPTVSIQGKISFACDSGHYNAEQQNEIIISETLLAVYATAFFLWAFLVNIIPKHTLIVHFGVFAIILISILYSYLRYAECTAFNMKGEKELSLSISRTVIGVIFVTACAIFGLLITDGLRYRDKIGKWTDKNTVLVTLYIVANLAYGLIDGLDLSIGLLWVDLICIFGVAIMNLIMAIFMIKSLTQIQKLLKETNQNIKMRVNRILTGNLYLLIIFGGAGVFFEVYYKIYLPHYEFAGYIWIFELVWSLTILEFLLVTASTLLQSENNEPVDISNNDRSIVIDNEN